mmetsp:Transcript_9721/g.14056  ORF Transcript_9721/g.14056 Transcript_9721/m.14056 type:complete len:111 (+) Transcript_9721:264-596(+)
MRRSGFQDENDRLDELIERRKELLAILNVLKDNAVMARSRTGKPLEASECSAAVWFSSLTASKSSFFWMDAEAEVEPRLRNSLAEIDSELRVLCLSTEQRHKENEAIGRK